VKSRVRANFNHDKAEHLCPGLHLSGEVSAGDGDHRGILVAHAHATGVVVALGVGAGQGLRERSESLRALGVGVLSGVRGICAAKGRICGVGKSVNSAKAQCK